MNWISVKDKSPQHYDAVLVYGKLFCDDDDVEQIHIGFYSEDDVYISCDTGMMLIINVTHWMPLPELPKD